ncbi:NAD(P)/FAD-dependent oxidoreductase [Paenibacillus solisilvae]|uniref:NAD(P)/FAD-dependent oxidoreductase n=1 Tax=Paenibacillus solisilvae TaxID=2486751 RepID=A0ABW0VU95_9BACL
MTRQGNQTSEYDVIIVGARVAGSVFAYEMAKSGYKVLLLDRATFPSDTLSTHNIYSNSIAMLREMGIMDRLLQTGTPLYNRAYIQFENAVIDGHFPEVDGSSDCFCIRRTHLDRILVEHASAQPNVTTIEGFRVTDVTSENGIITGIIGRAKDGVIRSFSSKLVVGADGRQSTIRKLVNSKRKLYVPSDFASFVGYFSGFRQEGERCAELYKKGDKLFITFPTSDHLFVVGVMFPLEDKEWIQRFAAGSETGFRDLVTAGLPGSSFSSRLQEAELFGQVKGMLGYDNDWYEEMGEGWALLGDALSFKDPAVGQGMHDAIYSSRILSGLLTANKDWSSSWSGMGDAYQSALESKMMTRFGLACKFTKNIPISKEENAVNHLIGSDPKATQAFLGIYNYANEPEAIAAAVAEFIGQHS